MCISFQFRHFQVRYKAGSLGAVEEAWLHFERHSSCRWSLVSDWSFFFEDEREGASDFSRESGEETPQSKGIPVQSMLPNALRTIIIIIVYACASFILQHLCMILRFHKDSGKHSHIAGACVILIPSVILRMTTTKFYLDVAVCFTPIDANCR